METVDELVPLNADDIKLLETKRYQSFGGCGVLLIVVFIVAALAALLFLKVLLFSMVLGIVAILALAGGVWLLLSGKTEKKDVALDIQEGKKRRIHAPIDSKQIKDAPGNNRHRFTVAGQAVQSMSGLRFKYSMTVGEWSFPLTEEEYLGGAKKGDMVEFFVAPHSNEILSQPVKVS